MGISRGMTIADIGCGTGYCSVPLAALTGEKGRVFACDISEEMLDSLNEKIEMWNIGNITPKLSQESIIPIDDHSVDFIFLSMLIHELDSPLDFFSDLKRILKKGGRIGIVDWEKLESEVGPPLGERTSMTEAVEMLAREGLSTIKNEMIGSYHYAILSARVEDLRKEKVEKIAKKLLEEIFCLSEKKMRSAVIFERFQSVKAETVVEILQEFCNKASEKKPGYVEIIDSCLDINKMKETLGLEKMSEIYMNAKKMGYDGVVRLLMNPPPRGKKFSKYDFVEGQTTYDITLGAKRSLAKGLDKDVLDRIIYDEDQVVIKNILSNPRITERDVLKITSKRPIKPEILKIIFEAQKWSSRYVIKRSLVLNPFTPTGIALGLVNLMQYKDLKLIVSTGPLHEEVRNSAKDLLKRNY
jgi:ubiquinone/menaquinone biosynthesis C-methylase UbiE